VIARVRLVFFGISQRYAARKDSTRCQLLWYRRRILHVSVRPWNKTCGCGLKTKSVAWPKIFACKCRGSKRCYSIFILSELFSLRINSETHAGAGRVIERNVETEWRHIWFLLRDSAAANSATAVKRLLANRKVVDLSYHPIHLTSRQKTLFSFVKRKAPGKVGNLGGGGGQRLGCHKII